MTPRKTIGSILKKIEVEFPELSEEDQPKYTIHVNGVLQELHERLALAERDLVLPAAYRHKGRSFIMDETDARIRLTEKETEKLYNEEYCKARAEDFLAWMLNNVPHGIFREFVKQFTEHCKQ